MDGLNVAVRRHTDGKYVGFLINLPQVICQADSEQELFRKIKIATNKYAAFLQNKENIITKEF